MTTPMSSRHARAGAAAALLAGAVMLSGCSSVVDQIPTWAGGLPDGAPQRLATPAPYPAVHDMPPSRHDVALSEAERKRLREDLAKTRERNAQAAKDATGSVAPAGATRNP